MFRNCKNWVNVLCLVVLLLCEGGIARSDDDGKPNAQTINAIRQAWNHRRDSIKSFVYVCSMEETKKVVHGKTDEFGRPVVPSSPVLDEVFHTTMTFAKQNGMLVFRYQGESWSETDEAKKPLLHCAAFDGHQNKQLFKQGDFTRGQFDHRSKPCDEVVNWIHEIPFWLVYDPELVLGRAGCDVKTMQVLSSNVQSSTAETDIEVQLARGTTQGKVRLALDSTHAYRPHRYIVKAGRTTVSELQIEYATNNQIGWVLKKWERKQFDLRGKLVGHVLGAVEKCEINDTLPDQLFDVKFPVGTPVVEEFESSRKYYITQADGSLKHVTKEEFNRPIKK